MGHPSTGKRIMALHGLVKFHSALAYLLCLALPAAFTQPGDHLFADPCTSSALWPIPLSVWTYFMDGPFRNEPALPIRPIVAAPRSMRERGGKGTW